MSNIMRIIKCIGLCCIFLLLFCFASCNGGLDKHIGAKAGNFLASSGGEAMIIGKDRRLYSVSSRGELTDLSEKNGLPLLYDASLLFYEGDYYLLCSAGGGSFSLWRFSSSGKGREILFLDRSLIEKYGILPTGSWNLCGDYLCLRTLTGIAKRSLSSSEHWEEIPRGYSWTEEIPLGFWGDIWVGRSRKVSSEEPFLNWVNDGHLLFSDYFDCMSNKGFFSFQGGYFYSLEKGRIFLSLPEGKMKAALPWEDKILLFMTKENGYYDLWAVGEEGTELVRKEVYFGKDACNFALSEKWIFFFSSEVKECNVLLNENWSENLQEVSVFQYLYDMETDRLYLLSAG